MVDWLIVAAPAFQHTASSQTLHRDAAHRIDKNYLNFDLQARRQCDSMTSSLSVMTAWIDLPEGLMLEPQGSSRVSGGTCWNQRASVHRWAHESHCQTAANSFTVSIRVSWWPSSAGMFVWEEFSPHQEHRDATRALGLLAAFCLLSNWKLTFDIVVFLEMHLLNCAFLFTFWLDFSTGPTRLHSVAWPWLLLFQGVLHSSLYLYDTKQVGVASDVPVDDWPAGWWVFDPVSTLLAPQWHPVLEPSGFFNVEASVVFQRRL